MASCDDLPDWVQLWRTDNGDVGRDDYLSTLPRYVVDKNYKVKCTINHWRDECDVNLAFNRHMMSSVLTNCRSQRCLANEDGDKCWCRYTINTCEERRTTVVFQQGFHVMTDLQVPTPPRKHLTPAMKGLLEDALDQHPAATAEQLFSHITSAIERRTLQGLPPLKSQVESFLKRWRRNHPGQDTQQVADMLNEALYDEEGLSSASPTRVVYFSDTVRHHGRWISSVGVGSSDDPFRVGMTCYKLLDAYIQVQRNGALATIVHVDSTFNTVAQKYPAFVIGYSDCGGHFFPLGYFCTSRRKDADVSWCLRALKRAVLDTFGEPFAAQFVMMDGDRAQHNACTTEIPSAQILMCWYHVMDNVFKHLRAKGVDLEASARLFEDMYDLHYAPRAVFKGLKASILAIWANYPKGSPQFAMGTYLANSWMNGKFCDWQAFWTPAGYPATNNPLEQYRKTYKIISNNSRATPKQMLEGMFDSMQSFMARQQNFAEQPEASVRLLKLFALLKPQRCLTLTRVPVGNMPMVLFKVHHTQLPTDNVELLSKVKKVCSVNSIRAHVEGVPDEGWFVDIQNLFCGCLYHAKHGMCLHVLAAGLEAGVRVPGTTTSQRVFVPNVQRPRRRARTSRSGARIRQTDQNPTNNNEDSQTSREDDFGHVQNNPAVADATGAVDNSALNEVSPQRESTLQSQSSPSSANNTRRRLQLDTASNTLPQLESPTSEIPRQGQSENVGPINQATSLPTRRSSRHRRPTQRSIDSLEQTHKRRR